MRQDQLARKRADFCEVLHYAKHGSMLAEEKAADGVFNAGALLSQSIAESKAPPCSSVKVAAQQLAAGV